MMVSTQKECLPKIAATTNPPPTVPPMTTTVLLLLLTLLLALASRPTDYSSTACK